MLLKGLTFINGEVLTPLLNSKCRHYLQSEVPKGKVKSNKNYLHDLSQNIFSKASSLACRKNKMNF